MWSLSLQNPVPHQDIRYPTLLLALWRLDRLPSSHICTPPSKVHPHSCELAAGFLRSLLYRICFSPSCVWKNSSVFLLIISFLWTLFLVVISKAPNQITTCCHNDQSSTRLRVWLCYDLEDQDACECHVCIFKIKRKDE